MTELTPRDTAKVTVTIEVDAIVADPSDTASVMAALGDFTNVSRANDEPGVIGWQLMKVEVDRRYRTRGEPDGKGALAGEGELMTGVEVGGTVHKDALGAEALADAILDLRKKKGNR